MSTILRLDHEHAYCNQSLLEEFHKGLGLTACLATNAFWSPCVTVSTGKWQEALYLRERERVLGSMCSLAKTLDGVDHY